VVGLAVALGAAGAKQAFDSIVQRDAPDANRGRSFARFETRFQLIWVAGAVLGIAPMPMWLGFLIVAGTAAFAAASYTAGSRGTRLRAERRRRRAERAERDEDGDDAPPPVPPSIATPSRADRTPPGGGNDDVTRIEDEP
jgi:hypothetical protein